MSMLARMGKVQLHDTLGEDHAIYPLVGGSLDVLSSQLQNKEEELKKLASEKKRLEAEVARGTGMLNNQGFLAKAPAAKVEQEKKKLEDYQRQLEVVLARLRELEG